LDIFISSKLNEVTVEYFDGGHKQKTGDIMMQSKQLLILAFFTISTLGLGACAAKAPKQKQIDVQKKTSSVTAPTSNYKLPPVKISAAFPFQSKYITVNGSRMHYVDEGKGDPVIFIHGNPTSSYLWRNIIPYVTDQHRVIAIDLIGMGQSAKPDINYTFSEHYQYVESFIKQLGLRNVTLVIHDWGAAIGFEYARRHSKNIKAIAFMEGVLPPTFPQSSYEAMGKDMGGLFKMLRDPVKGKHMVIDNNGFVEKLLPAFTNRTIGETEMAVYRAPYKQKASRKPTLVWPLEVPIGGQPADTTFTMKSIEKFMAQTELPILMLYASPGAVLPPSVVPWYKKTIKNLETVYIGQGLHFIQEDQPDAIGRALNDWLRRHHN